jgi:hypothetical protein
MSPAHQSRGFDSIIVIYIIYLTIYSAVNVNEQSGKKHLMVPQLLS